MKKILISGAAGFIGFHLSKSLLDDGYYVFCIDNLNEYYDPSLKQARLDILNKYSNFTFEKIDISDRESLTESFESFKPQKVINIAAQAGVRYSIENPYAYMDSNLIGFLNIIELCRHNNVEGLIYASSSSVYGANKKIPFSVEGRARMEAEAAFANEIRDRAHHPEDQKDDRCEGITLPVEYGGARVSGGHSRIVQNPGQVSFYYESGHQGGQYRDIPLDGRGHPSDHIRQWFGHSVGRWEGDTLVVDVSNFSDKTSFHGSHENLHLVEQFTRAESDVLIYRVTIDDPTTFTQPWTIEVPLVLLDNKTNQIYESACQEGNYSLTSILAGERALERAGRR